MGDTSAANGGIRSVRALYVDAGLRAATGVRNVLSYGATEFALEDARDADTVARRLAEDHFDLVLIEVAAAGWSTLDLVERVRGDLPDVPVIALVEPEDEQLGAQSLSRGASEYVVLSDRAIRRLPHTLHTVLERADLEQDRRRAADQLILQQQVLEMTATGAPLKLVLDGLCRLVERQVPASMASVLLVGDDGLLHPAAAPSLPVELVKLLEGFPIGPKQASCGTAAYTGRPVYTGDVATDPNWESYRDASEVHGVRGCWSHPFLADDGAVAGTFALTRREPGTPDAFQADLLATAAMLASIATQNDRRLDALRSARNLTETVFETADVLIAILDVTDRRIVRWNRACAELSGYALDEVGEAWERMLPRDEAPLAHAAIEDLLAGNSHPTELTLVTRSGERRRVIWSNDLIRDARGEPRYIMGTGIDVTLQRQAEDQKARLEAELRHAQKMEAIGVLASGVAHDFNNLLTAIYGHTDLAKATLPANHPAVRSLELVEEAASAAEGVSRALLTFGLKTPVKREPIDLADAVRRSVRLFQRLMPRSIEVVEEIDPDEDVWVDGDLSLLQQVVMNLVVNARDAMPDGGTMTLSVRLRLPDETGPVATDLDQGEGVAVIEVKDTGVGMDDATKARIFEPFFTTKARERGTGLGLSVLHGIVREHGGHVQVDSAPGEGSRFRVMLPACARPSLARPGDGETTARTARGEVVLVAEDDDYVRSIVVSGLRAAGFATVAAPDGAAALEAIRDGSPSPSVAVLDLDLPRVGGAEVARELRARQPDVPIVAITGSAEAPDLPAPHRLLRKPFHMSALVSLVQELLGSQPCTTTPA